MTFGKRWIGLLFASVLALGLLSLQPPLSTNAQFQTLRFHHLTPAQGLANEIVLSVLRAVAERPHPPLLFYPERGVGYFTSPLLGIMPIRALGSSHGARPALPRANSLPAIPLSSSAAAMS